MTPDHHWPKIKKWLSTDLCLKIINNPSQNNINKIIDKNYSDKPEKFNRCIERKKTEYFWEDLLDYCQEFPFKIFNQPPNVNKGPATEEIFPPVKIIKIE